MASSIRATYEDGSLRLAEPIDLEEGAEVEVIVLTPEPNNGRQVGNDEWKALSDLVDDCQMDTGISDLAHQHDHYLYGNAKKD